MLASTLRVAGTGSCLFDEAEAVALSCLLESAIETDFSLFEFAAIELRLQWWMSLLLVQTALALISAFALFSVILDFVRLRVGNCSSRQRDSVCRQLITTSFDASALAQ